MSPKQEWSGQGETAAAVEAAATVDCSVTSYKRNDANQASSISSISKIEPRGTPPPYEPPQAPATSDTIVNLQAHATTAATPTTPPSTMASEFSTEINAAPVRRRSALKAAKPPRAEDCPLSPTSSTPHFLSFMDSRSSSIVAPSRMGMGGMLFSRANVRTPSDCPLELEAGNNGTAIVVVGRRRRASDPGVRPVINTIASFSGRAAAPTPTPASRREEHQARRLGARNHDKLLSLPPSRPVDGAGGAAFSARLPCWAAFGGRETSTLRTGGDVLTPRSKAIAVGTYVSKITGTGARTGATGVSTPKRGGTPPTGASIFNSRSAPVVASGGGEPRSTVGHARTASGTMKGNAAPFHGWFTRTGNVNRGLDGDGASTVTGGHVPTAITRRERAAELERDSDQRPALSSSSARLPLEKQTGDDIATDEQKQMGGGVEFSQSRMEATHNSEAGPGADAAAGGTIAMTPHLGRRSSIGGSTSNNRVVVNMTPTRSLRCKVMGGRNGNNRNNGITGSAMSVSEFADKVAVLADDVVAILGMHARRGSCSKNSGNGSCAVETMGVRKGGNAGGIASNGVSVQRKAAGGGR